jgi:DNA invertase Pin-like site-specific DNA recombinase
MEVIVMKFVVYYRLVMNKKGLVRQTLTTQKKKVDRQLASEKHSPNVIGEFTEMENSPMIDRPALDMALKLAAKQKATLLIPNLDRLITNRVFVQQLCESSVQFKCLDFLEIDREMLRVRLQFAEFERAKISERTKEALGVLITSGVKLGTPKPRLGGKARGKQMVVNADAFSKKLLPIVAAILKKKQDATYREIASALESRGAETFRGGDSWSASQARNLLLRLGVR